MFPTFVVIGARKAGTTSLFRYLSAHPQVWMPPQKRLEFFSGPAWEHGPAWYEAQFARAGAAVAVGEASTAYALHPLAPEVPARMATLIPGVRLIYLVRHPIDRMVSQYAQARDEGWEQLPIDEALLTRNAEYIAPSRYAMQLDRYLEHFARQQLLVVTTDELRDERAATLERVLRHIGVEPAIPASILDRTFNRATSRRRAIPAVRRALDQPAVRRPLRLLPAPVRRAGWRLGSRATSLGPDDVTPSAACRAAVLDQLRPDLRRLRTHLGEDFHCWGLLDGDPVR